MKIIITESQYNMLLTEVDEQNLQKVANYVTRAVKKKFPVVYDIIITQSEYDRVNIFIYVNQQLERGSRMDDSSVITERNILNYLKSILTKFFGLEPYIMSFDSENFKYSHGNYKISWREN